jgi:hypothetical protein
MIGTMHWSNSEGAEVIAAALAQSDDVRQDGGGLPRVVIRSFHTGDRFDGADVYVGGWRVNHRRYSTVAGASRRAAREIRNTAGGRYGIPA